MGNYQTHFLHTTGIYPCLFSAPCTFQLITDILYRHFLNYLVEPTVPQYSTLKLNGNADTFELEQHTLLLPLRLLRMFSVFVRNNIHSEMSLMTSWILVLSRGMDALLPSLCEVSYETRWNRYILQTDTLDVLQILCPHRILWQEKDLPLSVWTSARQKRVYLLIFRLIKSDCDCRNILIFLISLLPLIITCKMGDVD